MIISELHRSVRSLYWLTFWLGAIGFVSYFAFRGFMPALDFALGVVGSFCNLWLFVWLTGTIARGDHARKSWRAGLFILRYVLLILFGYVIVKALNVNGLAILVGLLASTAAVLVSLTIEIVGTALGHGTSH